MRASMASSVGGWLDLLGFRWSAGKRGVEGKRVWWNEGMGFGVMVVVIFHHWIFGDFALASGHCRRCGLLVVY